MSMVNKTEKGRGTHTALKKVQKDFGSVYSLLTRVKSDAWHTEVVGTAVTDCK